METVAESKDSKVSMQSIIEGISAGLIAQGHVTSNRQINDCYFCSLAEAAEHVAKLSGLKAQILTTHDFTKNREGDQWDPAQLAKHGATLPASALAPSRAGVHPEHAWIFHGGKHYDAECPMGTSSFLELPIFQRSFQVGIEATPAKQPEKEQDQGMEF